MGTFRDFRDLRFVVSPGLARFWGPCLVHGVRAEEVLIAGTCTSSAIPHEEEILT